MITYGKFMILAFACVWSATAIAQYAGCPSEKKKNIWCNEAVSYCSMCPLANCGGLNGCSGAVMYAGDFECEGNPGQQTKCVQKMVTVVVVKPDGTIGQVLQPVSEICYRVFKCTQRSVTLTLPNGQQQTSMMCLADLGTPDNSVPPRYKPVNETKPCS
jgi:hypothetical protein